MSCSSGRPTPRLPKPSGRRESRCARTVAERLHRRRVLRQLLRHRQRRPPAGEEEGRSRRTIRRQSLVMRSSSIATRISSRSTRRATPSARCTQQGNGGPTRRACSSACRQCPTRNFAAKRSSGSATRASSWRHVSAASRGGRGLRPRQRRTSRPWRQRRHPATSISWRSTSSVGRTITRRIRRIRRNIKKRSTSSADWSMRMTS